MKIQQSTVGPIVGYTETTQSRVFLRGEAEYQGREFRRCFGVVRYRKNGLKTWSKPIFNKLSPNFDMTGIFVLNSLLPNTSYEYQAGWFFADAELDTVKLMDEKLLEWPADAPVYSLKTSVSHNQGSRSYVVGSCRYLLRLFGGNWFDDRGDKVFASVLQQISAGRSVDALLMIGDQIYADDLNILAPDKRMDQFLDRYRTVFSQPYISQLMARVPTYMILDDHEIEDNWPAKSNDKDRLNLYPHAIHAYQIYQSSHSPIFTATKDGRIEGTPSRFWYSFSEGCADWFVTDSRTERVLSATTRRMLGDAQLEALFAWLRDGSGQIKFIVTSVPFFPDLNAERQDKWSAFPEQRARILEHIKRYKIPKVVFVSGDVHCSLVSEMQLPDADGLKVYSVISSSFFWPYPHTQQSDFQFNQPLVGLNPAYVSKALSPVVSEDNFARIDASPTTLSVSFYERKGDLLGKAVSIKF